MLPFFQGTLIFLLLAFVPVQQASSGVTQPRAGETISGVVEVVGSAVHPDYLRYELAFLYLDGDGSDWIVFAEGNLPVINGTLAVWDTTVGRSIGSPVFPDGRYQIRLRVVKTDYNYDEYFVTDLMIVNDGPTPTPTLDKTAVSLTAEGVPPALPTGNDAFQQATPLPSLTPFPTPTLQATPFGNAPAAPQLAAPSAGGLIGQFGSARWGRVGSAFLLGAIGTVVLFALGVLYLLLRAIGRRLWRMYHRRT